MINTSVLSGSVTGEVFRSREAVINAHLGSELAGFLDRCIGRLQPARVSIERQREGTRTRSLSLVVEDVNTARFSDTGQPIRIVWAEADSMRGYRLGECTPTQGALRWGIHGIPAGALPGSPHSSGTLPGSTYSSGTPPQSTYSMVQAEMNFQVSYPSSRPSSNHHGIDPDLLGLFTGGSRASRLIRNRPAELSNTHLDRVLASLNDCEAFSRTPIEEFPIEGLSVAITAESAHLYGTDAINRWVDGHRINPLNQQPISHLFPLNDIRNELIDRLKQPNLPETIQPMREKWFALLTS